MFSGGRLILLEHLHGGRPRILICGTGKIRPKFGICLMLTRLTLTAFPEPLSVLGWQITGIVLASSCWQGGWG